MPTIDPPALREFVERIFVATGSPAGDADAVATHLVEANLKGHDSHGVIRVQQYVDGAQAGRIQPGATTDTESETETTAVLNGNWNYGQVVARDTMAKAIEKAQASGVGIVVAHQAAHAGRIGAYGEQATRAGMIAIACVTVHGGGQLVAPFGGAARRLSTNPLVVAAPTNDPDAPFVLDMATSMGAEGKVRVARNRGAQLAPDWILDGEGNPTTDPWDLYGGDPPGSRSAGALLPVGGPVGHKGFGLSMAVELLAGALTPAGTVGPDPKRAGNALFMLAFDPNRFVGAAPFSDALSGLVEYVKSPPFAPGFDEVLTAGEPERRRMAQRQQDGIPLDEATWEQIGSAADTVGV
ncbi:MAG: Ldh family oxidoreductase, partial [Chloroflexi bacterium]|nr:Ldh family oxidoreductase [Chloroflexota bacterium]